MRGDVARKPIPTITPEIRADFELRVERVPFDTCWHWAGTIGGKGYAVFNISLPGLRLEERQFRAHRVAWMIYRGDPTTDPLKSLDHLCKVRACVNPEHLELVSHAENLRRGDGWGGKHFRATECPHGHPYAGENLYVNPLGFRVCRQCARDSARRHWLKKHGRVA